jgi:hypothetical protein
LPFNIRDYTDVIIVLKQVFGTKSLSNRKDKINNIVFKYYLENKFDWKEYSLNVLIFILYSIFLVLSTFIIFYATSILFNILLCTETINNNNLEVIGQSTMSSDIMKENTSVKYNNKCAFSIFSDFFDKSCSSYKYYPKYFIGTNLNITYGDNNLSSLNYIISKQFYVLDKTVQEFTKYFNNNESLKYDLNAIATEYSYYKEYCIPKKIQ